MLIRGRHTQAKEQTNINKQMRANFRLTKRDPKIVIISFYALQRARTPECPVADALPWRGRSLPTLEKKPFRVPECAWDLCSLGLLFLHGPR